MVAAAEGFGEGEGKFLHFLSTIKANLRQGEEMEENTPVRWPLCRCQVLTRNSEDTSILKSEICKEVQQQNHLQVEPFL